MLPGATAALLALAACALVYSAGPRRRLNRVAAVVLLVDAVHILTSGLVSITVITDAPSLYAAWILHTVLDIVQVPLYLTFIAVALDTPLARPFRRRAVMFPIWAATGTVAAFVIARPEIALATVYPVEHWYFRHWGETLGLVTAVFFAASLTFFYTLAAAIHAWRRAPTPIARRRARAYVVAFGVRDVAWGFAFASGFARYAGVMDASLDGWATGFLTTAPLLILFPVLLLYGILRHQVLDIDLRIKSGVRRSVVVAAFVVTFFLASEGVEAVVSGRAGTLAGLAAAGALLFALRPLERRAARLADRLMPAVEDTKEYRDRRAREIYRAALEDALRDGEITPKERGILDGLGRNLGLAASEAKELERAAAASAGNAP